MYVRSFAHRRLSRLIAGILGLLAIGYTVVAQEKTALPTTGKKSPPPLPIGVVTDSMWNDASRERLKSGEIDDLLAAELRKIDIPLAPRIADHQFIRRVMLDLTGKLPLPADVTEFVSDPAPDKRAKL